MKTCVMIGGGLGGLVTGALLAKEGWQVTVLEKNAIVGGGLQTFQRHGVSFPTGMHVFGGFSEGGNMQRLFSYLGVLDRIKLRQMDSNASDVVTLLDEGLTYRLPQGKEQYVAYLSEHFPAEKEKLKNYVHRLFGLTEEEDLFYLRVSPAQYPGHSDDFMGSVDRLRDAYLFDPRLKYLLSYLNPLFGGAPQTTPAYIHALLQTLHINGTYQFVDGSQQLADALTTVIEKAGGKVVADEEVVRIAVEGRRVTGVYTRKGQCYQADSYVSDVHPDVLLRIIDPQAFTTAFKTRIHSVPETASSFKMYVKLKDKAFPYCNHARFCLSHSNTWPQRLMFVTPPVQHQGDYAETLVVIAPMDFAQVKPWEHTLTGHHGEEYKLWKLDMMNRMKAYMEKVYPGFSNCIEFAFAASPLTIRDYYGNKEGSNYGFQRDSRNPMLSQLSVTTKVENLFLTGQNVNIHGLCGVSLTAIETTEALEGHNTIVRKINESR